MDINCTYNCVRQINGKCVFINNPENLAPVVLDAAADSGCPYCVPRGPRFDNFYSAAETDGAR